MTDKKGFDVDEQPVSDEQMVKRVWPDAHATFDGVTHWIWRNMDIPKQCIGARVSEVEAWADAASKLPTPSQGEREHLSVGGIVIEHMVLIRHKSSLLAGNLIIDLSGTTTISELNDCLEILQLFKRQVVRLIDRFEIEETIRKAERGK